MAQRSGESVVLVHAFDAPPLGTGFAGEEVRQSITAGTAAQEAREAQELTDVAEALRADGIDVTTVAEGEDPVDLILRVAKEHDASTIVVGSHGRRGLRRALMDSVAEEVLRQTDRPVLIVPA